MVTTSFKFSRPVRRLARQRGASLLEVIAYLGVAAVVILSAVSLLGSAFSNAQSNQTAQDLVSIRTAVKKLYTNGDYGTSGDITALLATAGALPSTLKNTSGSNGSASVTNAWGGAVTVTGNGGTFAIKYANVPRDVCMNTVSGATGWTSVAGTAGSAVSTMPVSPSNAGTVCSADANDITFTAS